MAAILEASSRRGSGAVRGFPLFALAAVTASIYTEGRVITSSRANIAARALEPPKWARFGRGRAPDAGSALYSIVEGRAHAHGPVHRQGAGGDRRRADPGREERPPGGHPRAPAAGDGRPGGRRRPRCPRQDGRAHGPDPPGPRSRARRVAAHPGGGHADLAQAGRRAEGRAAGSGGAEGPVRVHRAPAPRARGGQDGGGRDPEAARGGSRPRADRAARDPRKPERRRSQRGGPLPVPGEVRARPHRAGAQGQARSGHRPRRRGPPRGPGPLPPHQEQPRAHRRARRRQDRHRGGPRPAHRLRRRAGVAEEQEAGGPRPRGAHRGGEVPGRVRGPAEGGAEGSPGVGRKHHPVHRRAAHHGRARAPPKGRWTPRTC